MSDVAGGPASLLGLGELRWFLVDGTSRMLPPFDARPGVVWAKWYGRRGDDFLRVADRYKAAPCVCGCGRVDLLVERTVIDRPRIEMQISIGFAR
jgi:hypothetical protein